MREAPLAFGAPATRNGKRPYVLAAPEPTITAGPSSNEGHGPIAGRTAMHEWMASSAPPNSTDAGTVTTESPTYSPATALRSSMVAHSAVDAGSGGETGTQLPAYSEGRGAAREA